MARNTSGLIAPTFDRSRHTILVVDDNPATRYSTERVIRAAGFQTVEAETGATAITLAQTNVSAVVLDVHLPDMSGFDVCRALRGHRDTSRIPVVHLSAAYVESAHQVAGLNAGADAYMVHPVEPQLLVATLQALIRARLAEDSLRRSESRFRAIYDRAPAAMLLVNGAGHIADANAQALALLQRTRQDILGQALVHFVPPPWADSAALHLAASAGQSWQGEFPLITADGTERMIEWNFSEPVEADIRLAIAQDLTESLELQRQREELLEREQAARVLAERHSRTKDDFVAVLSHELRTPLTLLSGWAHMLKRPNLSEDMLSRGIDAIEKGVKAQSRIISDILDISRLSAGKLHLHREAADVDALTQQSLDALRDPANVKEVSIRFQPSGSQCAAWLDITRFQQIVWNLVTNSIKFSERGGTVHVTLQREGDVLQLQVRDQGAGISPEFLPHIFERFSQDSAPDVRGHGGLGLGLSIVKHLAELHGGSVTAHSAGRNEGATMTVVLQVGEGDLANRSEPGDQTAPTGNLRGKDVLVVEDNQDTSEMLRLVLTDQGASVRIAEDFDAGMSQLHAQWPDLLISDIGLPGKDGYQLIQAVRSAELEHAGTTRLRAVALSAFAREQDKSKALAAGFDVHLSKPLQPHLLVRALCA